MVGRFEKLEIAFRMIPVQGYVYCLHLRMIFDASHRVVPLIRLVKNVSLIDQYFENLNSQN